MNIYDLWVHFRDKVEEKQLESMVLSALNNKDRYDVLAAIVAHPKNSPTEDILKDILNPSGDFDKFIQGMVDAGFISKFETEGNVFYIMKRNLAKELVERDMLFQHADELNDELISCFSSKHYNLVQVERPDNVKKKAEVVEEFIDSVEQQTI